MLSKFKGYFTRAGTKSKIVLSSCLALGMTLAPSVVAFAETIPGEDFNQNPDVIGGGGETMENVFSGVADVITSVLTPAANFCTTNTICLGFLGCTFATIGFRLVKRAINAFGRGR